jgi:hypothetical protein
MNWLWVKQFVASDAFSTLVAGAFGAFFGAWGAQAVISRGQSKQSMVGELNSISAALALCFTISNHFMSLKRQHVRALRDDYEQALQDFEASWKRPSPPGQPKVIEVRADLQTLTPLKVPIDRLERHIFEKISIRGRAPVAATDLIAAIDSLERSIEYRNGLITEIRQGPALSPLALAERYFGLTDANGRRDERFRQSITAIFNQTDDCIFFSRILADDLLAYGAALRRRYIWKFVSRFPKFVPADWSVAESEGLIPTEEQYANWLRGFKKSETGWQQVRGWIRARLQTTTAINDGALMLVQRLTRAASEIQSHLPWRRRAHRRRPIKPLPRARPPVKPLPLP